MFNISMLMIALTEFIMIFLKQNLNLFAVKNKNIRLEIYKIKMNMNMNTNDYINK